MEWNEIDERQLQFALIYLLEPFKCLVAPMGMVHSAITCMTLWSYQMTLPLLKDYCISDQNQLLFTSDMDFVEP